MKKILLPIGLLCSVALCFSLIHIGNMKAATGATTKITASHETSGNSTTPEICPPQQ